MGDVRDSVTAEDAFTQQFDGQMLRQRTVMIGQVVSFNATANTIVAQPVLQRQFINDSLPSNLPLLNDVPVCFFGAGGFWLTVSPVAGDYCVLMVSDRAIERWKQNGGIVSPVKARHHDMNDAVAYMGINPFNNAIPSVASGAIHLRSFDGQAGVKLSNSSIELIQGGSVIGTVTASNVAFTVNVTAPDFITDSGISLKTHTHPGDSGGTTGPPQ